MKYPGARHELGQRRVARPACAAYGYLTASAMHTGPVGTTDVQREISAAVRSMDSAAFTSIHILDRVPAIFEGREQYAAWRSDLGAELEVDPLCIVVVGSTAVGVSLSPHEDKRFRPYHDESDVDVAVISPRHFDEAWRWLRALGPLDALKGRPDEADLLGWHRRSLVFDGTIATDRLLPYLPFGAAWQSALGRASRRAPTLDRDVKARIYRDFESLREYHRRNVESLKAKLWPEPPAGDPMVATDQKAETE